MPVISRKNQYRGINAHLHSYFQHDPGGSWAGFHTIYIGDLFKALDARLPLTDFLAFRLSYRPSLLSSRLSTTLSIRMRSTPSTSAINNHDDNNVAGDNNSS